MNDDHGDHEEELALELDLSDEELRLIKHEAELKGTTDENVIRDIIQHQFRKDDLDQAIRKFRVSMTALMQHQTNGSMASSAAACQELSEVLKKVCIVNITTSIDATRNLQIEQKKLIASIELAFWLALLGAEKERSEGNEN